MKIRYTIEIKDPANHILSVKMIGDKKDSQDKLQVFLPSWSPGSYLMREYAKNIRTLSAITENGEFLNTYKVDKGSYELDWSSSELNQTSNHFEINYDIYCHDLTVRTSHIDVSHAFLHGPSVLMGVVGENLVDPVVQVRFPGLWSKLHTGLKDISTQREEFLYTAKDYDDLIDCPIEIGCHESDGFMAFGKEHHLVFYGEQFPHKNDLKADIKKIVETIGAHFDRIPYESYLFMTHFAANLYGGLEHKNSTALQFDGRKLSSREDYINWLCLVSHEYFHTWNVKRIRPKELGPFDYQNENYTRMHWLTEGLTSFMDELLVLRSGLISLKEYLQMQTKNLNRYFSIPGKKFHSLEDSSFDAWIKLYRPDENSNNSSISYYLKGGLVFSTLHFEMVKRGKNINDLMNSLWKSYEADKSVGLVKDDVLKMITEITDQDCSDLFEERVSTTKDIDFESYYKEYGMEFEYEQSTKPYLGADFTYKGDRVVVNKVHLDGPMYKAGINAGDEILAINGVRALKSDFNDLSKILCTDTSYVFAFSRLSKLDSLAVIPTKAPRTLKAINVVDEKLAKTLFL